MAFFVCEFRVNAGRALMSKAAASVYRVRRRLNDGAGKKVIGLKKRARELSMFPRSKQKNILMDGF
jgi:hypothetical protein